jgi:nitrate/nitrite-specific signal transduction histidine kinase
MVWKLTARNSAPSSHAPRAARIGGMELHDLRTSRRVRSAFIDLARVRRVLARRPSKLSFKLLAVLVGAVLLATVISIFSVLFMQSCVGVLPLLPGLPAELASICWWLGISNIITLTLLIGLFMPALEKFVTRPVGRLARGAVEVGAGNLDYLCRVAADDELGELAASFDVMRGQVKAMLDAKDEQNRELRTLNDIARITSQLLDPQQILDLTIHVAVTSLRVQAGAIRLIDREHGHSILHACYGMPPCDHQTCDLRAANIALAQRQTPASSDQDSFPLADGDIPFGIQADAQGRSFVGIPLEAKGVLVGGLTLITHPGQVVTEEGKRTLNAIGQQIGLAVLNALRFQQARYQATLEERERLAREMHDSLAQALGYLKLKASIAEELLSGGQIDQAQVNLREVKEIAGETYFDVRETIFGLRNSSSKGLQFIPALEAYLAKYGQHYGLQVRLVAEENCRPSFSPEVALQLTRIIQEALTNVRKHANCNEATIHLERVDHHWRISVEDDGAGFDSPMTHSEGWRYLGLHIMEERAEGIGAKLQVDSQPGHGTRVIIRVPFEAEH